MKMNRRWLEDQPLKANGVISPQRIPHLVRSFNADGEPMCLACRANDVVAGSEWCKSCLAGLKDFEQWQLEAEMKAELAKPEDTLYSQAAKDTIAYVNDVHKRYRCYRKLENAEIEKLVREARDTCSVCRKRPASRVVFKNPLRLGGAITSTNTLVSCRPCSDRRNRQVEDYIAKHSARATQS